MNEFETCERCDGSGADPRQGLYFEFDLDLGVEPEIEPCAECGGDGAFARPTRVLVGVRAA